MLLRIFMYALLGLLLLSSEAICELNVQEKSTGLNQVLGLPLSNIFDERSYRDISFDSPSMFDVGVADINGDSILDIYTSAHSGRQNLLLGDGNGHYEESLSLLGLDQSREFPYLEQMTKSPSINGPGLYIHRQGKFIVFRNRGLEKLGTVSGRILVPSPGNKPSPIKTKNAHEATAEIIALSAESKETWIMVRFSVAPGGALWLECPYSLPYEITLDPTLPLRYVKVGYRLVNPNAHNFTLYWRDRHGLAWADLNQDSWMDVFMARGGLKSAIGKFMQPEVVSDELLISHGDGQYRDMTSQSGIVKRHCRTYKPAWVDFNRDNLLDLYLGCRGGPNMLFHQNPPGQFTEVAKKYGLALGNLRGRFRDGGDQFVWVDVDNDGDMDLVADVTNRLAFFINQGKGFDQHGIDHEFEGRVEQFAIGDFDADSDLDLYVIVMAGKNLYENFTGFLLVNHGGTLQRVDAQSVGLPGKCVAASWVDVDFDGKLDFHCVPEGIFIRNSDGIFENSGILGGWYEGANQIRGKAFVSWYDANNDGGWDVLMTLSLSPTDEFRKKMRDWSRSRRNPSDKSLSSRPYWRWSQTRLYMGGPPANHWLQVILEGPSGNRNALGAQISLYTGDRVQVRGVGSMEGAHFSQGHYRFYFGLGQFTKSEKLQVHWPDGKTKTLLNVDADQLLRISYP